MKDAARRLLLLSMVGVLVSSATRTAQASTKQRRLGILYWKSRRGTGDKPEPFFKHLAELGWTEGKNLVVEWRDAYDDFERREAAAKELVKAGADVLWTDGTPRTRALLQATTTIPIVTACGDPVGSGFAKTLAKPGGNVTGLSWAIRDIAEMQIQLLHAVLPNLATLAVIFPKYYPSVDLVAPLLDAVRVARISPESHGVSTLDDIEAALRALASRGRGAAFLHYGDPSSWPTIARLAIRHKIATMGVFDDYVRAGGLMSFRMYFADQPRRSAAAVAKIFRGENPANIPFELPTHSQLAVNQRTAAEIGVTIPSDVLLRADEVIK